MSRKRKRTNKEQEELNRAVAAALRRVAACGIDVNGFAAKSATALIQLVKAIDDCIADGRRHAREAAKYRINPTNLEAYGVKRSTINANPIFRAYVRHFEEQESREAVTLKKETYDGLMADLERLHIYQENAVDLGLQNQRLIEELEAAKREKEDAVKAYKDLLELIGQNKDFNTLLE